MRSTLMLAALSVGLSVPSFAPSAAHAQSHGDELARADSLFNAAKALLDSGQYVDACAKFAESKRLAPGLGVTLYLADCYERIGRTASAWTEFRSAEGLARQRDDKRADVARGRAQALEPRLDRLTIAVAPTLPQSGLQILRDGTVVSPEEWSIAVPVDPGDHVIVVSSPGHAQRTISAHVGAESPSATVRIDRLDDPAPASPLPLAPSPGAAPAPSSTPASTPASTSSPESSPADSGDTRRRIGIGVGAAGLVGVALGAAFGLKAASKLSQSNDGPCDAANTCDANGLSLRHDASGAATVSTIAFALGGVALAGGAVLYFTAPRSSVPVGLTLTPSPGGGSALVRASF